MYGSVHLCQSKKNIEYIQIWHENGEYFKKKGIKTNASGVSNESRN